MSTLLHLDSSPLDSSISRELTREFVNTWKAAHPDGKVIYRDVAAHSPRPVDAGGLERPIRLRLRGRRSIRLRCSSLMN